MPSRPLLLGYLATSGGIDVFASGDVEVGAADGWDMLLERICSREAAMEFGVDATTVRRILERLATIARGRSAGTGPLFKDDLALAFSQVCGYNPDEGSFQLLQRMPGLGVLDTTDGSRHLIDPSLADAAGAGDVVRYAAAHGADTDFDELQRVTLPLNHLGIAVSEIKAIAAGVTGSQALATAKRLQAHSPQDALVLDLARLALQLGETGEWPSLSFGGLEITDISFGDFAVDLDKLGFADCLIDTLDMTEYDGDYSLPTFTRCAFGVVKGVGSFASLPVGHFVDCSVDQFDASSKTTRGLLAMSGLSPRQRVLLTVLKKIYMQPGAARKASSLNRGLDDKLREHVPAAVEALLQAGLVVRGRAGGNVLYYPVRGATGRVRKMLEGGVSSTDSVLIAAR